MTLAIVLIVVFAVLLVAGLVRVMLWPGGLRAWASKSAGSGSAERRRVRGRGGDEPPASSEPTQDAEMWR